MHETIGRAHMVDIFGQLMQNLVALPDLPDEDIEILLDGCCELVVGLRQVRRVMRWQTVLLLSVGVETQVIGPLRVHDCCLYIYVRIC